MMPTALQCVLGAFFFSMPPTLVGLPSNLQDRKEKENEKMEKFPRPNEGGFEKVKRCLYSRTRSVIL